LILDQTWYALAAALLFGAGMAAAAPALRWQVKWLLDFPAWFVQLLRKVMAAKPCVPALGAFIFAFNTVAIFVYMLSGIVPGLPFLVVFLTGLNVALAGLMAREGATEGPSTPPPFSVRVCAALTFVLELPCFWYAMALGMSLRPTILQVGRGDANWTPLVDRLVAYLIIIVPLLAVSALVEAYAVSYSYRAAAANDTEPV
jgi:uncharacterized membrane protein SpoIIM required for sporulation